MKGKFQPQKSSGCILAQGIQSFINYYLFLFANLSRRQVLYRMMLGSKIGRLPTPNAEPDSISYRISPAATRISCPSRLILSPLTILSIESTDKCERDIESLLGAPPETFFKLSDETSPFLGETC